MDADVLACTACDARERELAGVRAQLDQAQARIDELEAGTQRLAEDLNQAQKRLEGARRAGKRQAAPFSRDAKKPDPKRPGRKAGKDYGPRARRQVPAPDEIDEIIVVDLPGRLRVRRGRGARQDGASVPGGLRSGPAGGATFRCQAWALHLM